MQYIENIVLYMIELLVAPILINIALKYYEEKITNKGNKVKKDKMLNRILNSKLIQQELYGAIFLAIVFTIPFLINKYYILSINMKTMIAVVCLILFVSYLLLLYKTIKKYTEGTKYRWISNILISMGIVFLLWSEFRNSILVNNQIENSIETGIFLILIVICQYVNNLEIKQVFDIKYIIWFKKKKYITDSEPVIEGMFLSFNYTCEGGEKKHLKVPIKKIKCIESIVENCVT